MTLTRNLKVRNIQKNPVKYRSAADMTNVTHEFLVCMITKFFTFTV